MFMDRGLSSFEGLVPPVFIEALVASGVFEARVVSLRLSLQPKSFALFSHVHLRTFCGTCNSKAMANTFA